MSQNQNGNKGSRPLAEQLKAALKPEEAKPQVIASNEAESEEEVEVGAGVEVEVETDDEADAVNETDADETDAEEEDEVAMDDSDSDEEGSDDEDDSETEEDSVFSTQPFAGLINQSITVVIGLGDAKDSNNLNFQNPFSKKAGVAREFIAGILPLMQDLAQREVLLLTDNFNQSVSAVLSVLSNNSVKQLETMFGNGTDAKQLGFPVTMSVRDMVAVDSDYPSMSIDTTLNVNMPSLTDAKNDVVIRNLFIYTDKLKEELGNIGLRFIIGFQTEELIKADSRTAFDELKERADAGELKLVVRSNSEALNDYGFDEAQIYNLFEDFDVVFVKA